MTVKRRTIARPVEYSGTGLHKGVACRLRFLPAEGGSGLQFRRMDLPGRPTIRAHVDQAVLTERRTQLGEDPVSVHTVEHVLAAVSGLGIDDLLMEIDGPEPPIADGSAKPFLEVLADAGMVESSGTVTYLDLRAPVRVVDGESVYEAHPANALSLDVTIDFPHPLIERQQGRYVVSGESFATELAPARTFGFIREVDMLRARGLIQGATTENAIVLDETGVVGTTLRWPDEFLRHKAMDCVGDLALAGARVRARVVATKPSHRGTILLVREMLRAAATTENTVYGIEEILKVLPHRYPFLLVDRVLEMDPKKRIVGIKNVTINEPFFQGHFPGHPIMPGVLIIEAMAQVGGMLLMGAFDDPESKVVYFMSLDNVKFRKPVKPGDQLRFELDMTQIRGRVCKMHGIAKVDGEVVAEADMAAMVRDR